MRRKASASSSSSYVDAFAPEGDVSGREERPETVSKETIEETVLENTTSQETVQEDSPTLEYLPNTVYEPPPNTSRVLNTKKEDNEEEDSGSEFDAEKIYDRISQEVENAQEERPISRLASTLSWNSTSWTRKEFTFADSLATVPPKDRTARISLLSPLPSSSSPSSPTDHDQIMKEAPSSQPQASSSPVADADRPTSHWERVGCGRSHSERTPNVRLSHNITSLDEMAMVPASLHTQTASLGTLETSEARGSEASQANTSNADIPSISIAHSNNSSSNDLHLTSSRFSRGSDASSYISDGGLASTFKKLIKGKLGKEKEKAKEKAREHTSTNSRSNTDERRSRSRIRRSHPANEKRLSASQKRDAEIAEFLSPNAGATTKFQRRISGSLSSAYDKIRHSSSGSGTPDRVTPTESVQRQKPLAVPVTEYQKYGPSIWERPKRKKSERRLKKSRDDTGDTAVRIGTSFRDITSTSASAKTSESRISNSPITRPKRTESPSALSSSLLDTTIAGSSNSGRYYSGREKWSQSNSVQKESNQEKRREELKRSIKLVQPVEEGFANMKTVDISEIKKGRRWI